MNSEPFYTREITSALGEKVLEGIAVAVESTKNDLDEYREVRPLWVAEHSERGLANWIHDRLWRHLREQLGDEADVAFKDSGATREFRAKKRFLFRAKRHGYGDRIASFPTPSALEFWSHQMPSIFPEFGDVRLAAGYRWDRDLRRIEDAVISRRDGMDNVTWAVTVAVTPSSGTVSLRPVNGDEPALPIVELIDAHDEEEETGTDE